MLDIEVDAKGAVNAFGPYKDNQYGFEKVINDCKVLFSQGFNWILAWNPRKANMNVQILCHGWLYVIIVLRFSLFLQVLYEIPFMFDKAFGFVT